MKDNSVDKTPPLPKELLEAALAVRAHAHCRYSNFPVGAALLTPDGSLFTGCNVENVSYGLTNCAERVAIGTAVSAGHRQFAMLAVASPGGVSPCGACRQVLAEFCQDLVVYLVDAEAPQQVTVTHLCDLLPNRF